MTPQRLDHLASIVNGAKDWESVALYLDTHEALDIFDLALDGMTFRQQLMEADMRSNLDECEDWYVSKQMEELMNNRDYFAKPIQGARSQHDYGNSGPIVGMYEPGGSWRWIGYAAGSLVLVLTFFAWIS